MKDFYISYAFAIGFRILDKRSYKMDRRIGFNKGDTIRNRL